MNKVQELLGRVSGKKDPVQSALTPLVSLARELGCIGDLLGRVYEVKNDKGEVIATIEQKPLKLAQANVLLEELDRLKEIENFEANKGMPKIPKKRGKR